MELDYTDRNRRRARLYVGVGLFVALVVGGAVYLALNASGLNRQGEVAMRDVVVATRDIASRKPIEEGDVQMRRVAADPTNETAFTRIDEVLGRVSAVAIAPGQLVTRNMLASAVTGQTFSILEPGEEFDTSLPDLRAVSLSVPDDRALGGLLQPGQRVDVVASLGVNPLLGREDEQADPGAAAALDYVAGPTTKVTVQDVTVLAKSATVYVLRVDVATAEKIAELSALGAQFTLILRPDQDSRTAETDGSTIDSLIEEFGFPLPGPVEIEADGSATAEESDGADSSAAQASPAEDAGSDPSPTSEPSPAPATTP
jgi:Flp pilus assembly protein CpaB